MEKKDIITAILKYQDKKNQIILKRYGVELIPKSVAFTEENLNDYDIDEITRKFIPSGSVLTINCLHCCAWECDECPYTREKINCDNYDSPYQKMLDHPEYKEDRDLKKIGDELYESLEEFSKA